LHNNKCMLIPCSAQLEKATIESASPKFGMRGVTFLLERCVFHSLCDVELAVVLALILMASPVCGFAARASLALNLLQASETGHDEDAIFLGAGYGQLSQRFEE